MNNPFKIGTVLSIGPNYSYYRSSFNSLLQEDLLESPLLIIGCEGGNFYQVVRQIDHSARAPQKVWGFYDTTLHELIKEGALVIEAGLCNRSRLDLIDE